MSFWESFTDNFIGPIVTKLICMPYYRPWFEDLRNVKAFNLECARDVRIPVHNDGYSTDLVIPTLITFSVQRNVLFLKLKYTFFPLFYN